METQNLQFSLNELLLLERALCYTAPRTILGTVPVTDDDLVKLVLKVAHALTVAKDDRPLDLTLTQKECWLYREMINIFDRVGRSETAEGLSIKTKLYSAIIAFDLESHREDVPQLAVPEAQEVDYAKQTDDPS